MYTIKDFREDREAYTKQREQDQIMLAGRVPESSVQDKLSKVKEVESNINTDFERKADINDIEIVTSVITFIMKCNFLNQIQWKH